MATKVPNVPGLPQLPKDLKGKELEKYLSDLSRTLWQMQKSLNALIDENN